MLPIVQDEGIVVEVIRFCLNKPSEELLVKAWVIVLEAGGVIERDFGTQVTKQFEKLAGDRDLTIVWLPLKFKLLIQTLSHDIDAVNLIVCVRRVSSIRALHYLEDSSGS